MSETFVAGAAGDDAEIKGDWSQIPCEGCKGTGEDLGYPEPCVLCGGKGTFQAQADRMWPLFRTHSNGVREYQSPDGRGDASFEVQADSQAEAQLKLEEVWGR